MLLGDLVRLDAPLFFGLQDGFNLIEALDYFAQLEVFFNLVVVWVGGRGTLHHTLFN